jgi:ankyrin repeat protein
VTPLHRAAAQNHVELCGFLIECKANVNATDRYLAHILKKKSHLP